MKIYYAKEQDDAQWFKALTRGQVAATIIHLRNVDDSILHKIQTCANAGLKVIIRYDIEVWSPERVRVEVYEEPRYSTNMNVDRHINNITTLLNSGIPKESIIINIINVTPKAIDLENLRNLLSGLEDSNLMRELVVRIDVLRTPASFVKILENGGLVPPYGKHVSPSREEYAEIDKILTRHECIYEMTDETVHATAQENYCACEFIPNANLLDLARNRVAVEIDNMEYITL